MLEAYRKHVAERAELGVVPKPLSADQVADLIELLKTPPAGEEEFLVDLISNRVPPGVDEAAYVKAGFLSAVAKGEAESPLIDKKFAVKLLGTMLGGYNIATLIDLLDDGELVDFAADELCHTMLMFDAFHDVAEKADGGNAAAKRVMTSWADAEWFTSKNEIPEVMTVAVYKVPGETNTDDLSPAQDAWSRPDIPLHAKAMYKNPREGVNNAEEQINELERTGHAVALVGDVMGTGSSRKSATNSVLWYIGDDLPYIPNKRSGGVCIAGKIAPIFFNTMEDAGALPFECDVDNLNTGDIIDIRVYDGKIVRHGTDEVISEFELKTEVLLDEVRAGGRIPLIIGRGLTQRAREHMGLDTSTVFRAPVIGEESDKGYTLAQKMVGRACGVDGVRPGSYCEPKMTTVGSQDTTGPMTRDELKDLACLG
ncbi:MAG TPA: aconitate hydratase B, partial [Gammaproteobacteria bacterium]|nr:aconitate hydratase B [Gammaproteobacteria bacterium]